MKQSELIKRLTDKELRQQVVLTQTVFFVGSLLLSFFLFDPPSRWFDLFEIDPGEIVWFGIGTALIIVLIDLLIMLIFPPEYYDDGGVNKRLFNNITFSSLLLITMFVAIAEEMLFRGVIQSSFGYIVASITFALVHLRYLKKPVLLISVLFVSFLIGYIFELTGNLVVTITAHFITDFVLALLIRLKKEV
ncbi:CPBP family intramembrane glutamic endopeptidase [Virgibacillus halodenitrificans]|uniref:CPBP family intramembrane glutamic endopeptidase n=1 Tax=Virgibacillus halodenitrificans TaxID=1482 RepID=UPI00076143BC|nr:CPBP family intramembrane glutamic endopeptidase [Virgibacillus halodenitrificans]MCG1028275.1 CPBP family intramembrane metalloprotease [Virgibacillus halodenitrificans]